MNQPPAYSVASDGTPSGLSGIGFGAGTWRPLRSRRLSVESLPGTKLFLTLHDSIYIHMPNLKPFVFLLVSQAVCGFVAFEKGSSMYPVAGTCKENY